MINNGIGLTEPPRRQTLAPHGLDTNTTCGYNTIILCSQPAIKYDLDASRLRLCSQVESWQRPAGGKSDTGPHSCSALPCAAAAVS